MQAAEIFLVAVNMMCEHILPTARMHYYIADGGHAVNVVSDYAKVGFRYRGPNTENVLQTLSGPRLLCSRSRWGRQGSLSVSGGVNKIDLRNEIMQPSKPAYQTGDRPVTGLRFHRTAKVLQPAKR